MASGILGGLDYNRPKDSSTTVTNLEAEYKIISTEINKTLIQWFLTLNPANVAQVSTVTITVGSETDEYAVAVTVGTSVMTYRHKQTADDTDNTIAAFLSKIINTNDNIFATHNLNVITITSLIPGQAFTLDNSDSTDTNKVVLATTTANSGTPLHRKIADVEVVFSIGANGFPRATFNGKWYDGSSVPVLRQNFGPLVGNGSDTVDSIQTAAGVARPA